jgi:predicted metal-dependent hydrolase
VPAADRRFWKGVTQVAVGCCHVQRGNSRGAVALLNRAAANLRNYPSPHHSVDTAALIMLTCDVAGQVGRRGASPEIDFGEFPARH